MLKCPPSRKQKCHFRLPHGTPTSPDLTGWSGLHGRSACPAFGDLQAKASGSFESSAGMLRPGCAEVCMLRLGCRLKRTDSSCNDRGQAVGQHGLGTRRTRQHEGRLAEEGQSRVR